MDTNVFASQCLREGSIVLFLGWTFNLVHFFYLLQFLRLGPLCFNFRDPILKRYFYFILTLRQWWRCHLRFRWRDHRWFLTKLRTPGRVLMSRITTPFLHWSLVDIIEFFLRKSSSRLSIALHKVWLRESIRETGPRNQISLLLFQISPKEFILLCVAIIILQFIFILVFKLLFSWRIRPILPSVLIWAF